MLCATKENCRSLSVIFSPPGGMRFSRDPSQTRPVLSETREHFPAKSFKTSPYSPVFGEFLNSGNTSLIGEPTNILADALQSVSLQKLDWLHSTLTAVPSSNHFDLRTSLLRK